MKNVLLALVTLAALGGSAALALVPAGAVNASTAACNVEADGCCCVPCPGPGQECCIE
jgi:hypothetical protein